MKPLRARPAACGAVLLAALAWFAGCSDRQPTLPGISAAKPGGGSGDPTVTSADPNSAPQDTTLDVHVFGTNFDRGSKAEWARSGVASLKVVTNSTRFVTSKELIANITIAVDAETGLYDIIVTASTGKKGIGTELFTVTQKGRPPDPGYTPTDLGTLPGEAQSIAYDINEAGYVVGTSTHAFIWSLSTGMRALGVPPGTTSSGATGIAEPVNGETQIAGYAQDASSVRSAVLWTWSPLAGTGLMPSLWRGTAEDVNDRGQVVGSEDTGNNGRAAVLWQAGIGKVALGTLGGTNGRAHAINNAGHAVGWSDLAPCGPTCLPDHATLWIVDQSGRVLSRVDLDPGSVSSGAYDVSNPGNGSIQVVGWRTFYVSGSLLQRAWTWTVTLAADGSVTGVTGRELGGSKAFPLGVNGLGHIVGQDQSSGVRAALWTPDGVQWELAGLKGRSSSTANAINELGNIVGWSYATGTKTHAVLWTKP